MDKWSMSDYAPCAEVEPNVYLIRGLNRSRFPEANSLLVDDEILTLVDAGSNMMQIKASLSEFGERIEDIDRIVLTHYHIDHKGHAEEIRKLSGCEVLCHSLSDKGVTSFQGMAEFYGLSRHPRFDVWKSKIKMWLPHVISDYEITGHYEDGKAISCGETDLIPIHLPGHTLDHTCFGINGLKTIFLVDIDLTRFGPWYGNEVSDIKLFQDSIKRVIELEPRKGISSHLLEPVTRNLDIRLREYLAAFDEREARILEFI
ncbi:MAG: MBL fold metallo-hydrolase, partial [Candidatus Thorarchaeota archaeon]